MLVIFLSLLQPEKYIKITLWDDPILQTPVFVCLPRWHRRHYVLQLQSRRANPSQSRDYMRESQQ